MAVALLPGFITRVTALRQNASPAAFCLVSPAPGMLVVSTSCMCVPAACPYSARDADPVALHHQPDTGRTRAWRRSRQRDSVYPDPEP